MQALKRKQIFKTNVILPQKLKSWKKEIESNATNNILIKNLKSEKEKLNQLIDKRIKGVLLRSKAEWLVIKGRYISENVKTLHETIDYNNNLNEKGLIFFSDFNKALDSLDHNFLETCLLKFQLHTM